jgi:urease accessory protein
LEALVEQGRICDRPTLQNWMSQELRQGSIRLETAILWRACHCLVRSDLLGLQAWNQWLSATRETRELRQQNWQMGQSLCRLLADLSPSLRPQLERVGLPCNFAIAFALASHDGALAPETAMLGYLYSWSANLISAGVRLIPLGQTEGQQIQRSLRDNLIFIAQEISQLTDDELGSCSWGLSLASMSHETQYTRLFRS